jgi:hypothetical protein
MDEIQRRENPPSLPFIKRLLGMFVKNTSLKNSFGKQYVGKVGDHFLFA